jgi:hypothetical protein
MAIAGSAVDRTRSALVHGRSPRCGPTLQSMQLHSGALLICLLDAWLQPVPHMCPSRRAAASGRLPPSHLIQPHRSGRPLSAPCDDQAAPQRMALPPFDHEGAPQRQVQRIAAEDQKRSISVPSGLLSLTSKCSAWQEKNRVTFKRLPSCSPNWRSQQVRRISALRDRFRASWGRRRCSAPPA